MKSNCRLYVPLVLVASSVLAGCVRDTPPVVKVGLIAPFEELYREDGYAALNAMRLALLREAPAGDRAPRVALVALNDNGRPDEASAQAVKLALDDQVVAVVGPLQNAGAAAVGPILAAQELPWVAPLSLDPDQLVGGFGLSATPEEVGAAAVEALVESGAQDPLLLVGDQPGALAGAQAAAEAAGRQAMVQSSAEASAALDVAGGYAFLQTAAEAARQVRSNAIRAPSVGGPETGSLVYEALAGEQAEGSMWLSSGPTMTELPADFVEAYRSTAGVDPNPQSVLVYDATHLVLDAIALAGERGPISRLSVRDAMLDLASQGWTGLAGRIGWEQAVCGGETLCWTWTDAPIQVHRRP